MNRRNKAFSTIEYAALISIIVAALIGMSIYLKRALSDRWRGVGDGFSYGRQCVPGTKCLPDIE